MDSDITCPRVCAFRGPSARSIQEIELDEVEMPDVQDQMKYIGQIRLDGWIGDIERVEEAAPSRIVACFDELSTIVG